MLAIALHAPIVWSTASVQAASDKGPCIEIPELWAAITFPPLQMVWVFYHSNTRCKDEKAPQCVSLLIPKHNSESSTKKPSPSVAVSEEGEAEAAGDLCTIVMCFHIMAQGFPRTEGIKQSCICIFCWVIKKMAIAKRGIWIVSFPQVDFKECLLSFWCDFHLSPFHNKHTKFIFLSKKKDYMDPYSSIQKGDRVHPEVQ